MNYRETITDALGVVADEVSQTQTIDANLCDLYMDLTDDETVLEEWEICGSDFMARINRLRLKLFLEDVERFLADDKLLYNFVCQDPVIDLDLDDIVDIESCFYESIGSLLMPRHGPVIRIYQAVCKLYRCTEFENIPRYKSQILDHFKTVEEFEYYLLRPFSLSCELPFDGLFEKPDPDHDLDGSSPKPKQQMAKKAVTTSKSVKKTKNTKK